MSELFPSAKPADVSVANVEAQPVVANVDGKDAQQSATKERTYTGEQVEKIVKDRLAREHKKFEKSGTKPQAEITDDEPTKAQQVTPNVADDLKTKLTEERKRSRDLAEQVNKYREDSLKAQVERKLIELGCLDPEVVLDHFISRKFVHMDDDGLVVENATGNLDDLCRDYLAKKPHLVRGSATAGVGTRGPAPAISGDPKSITELEAALGIVRTNKTKLFGR